MMGLSRGAGQREVRLPAGRLRLRRPAARWHRLRLGPDLRAAVGHRLDPGRDRVPEDRRRLRPADRGAGADHAGAAQGGRRGRHPEAEPPRRTRRSRPARAADRRAGRAQRHGWLSRPSCSAFDRQHVWHPYAPLPAAVEPLLVRSASGVRLQLADGRRADRRHVVLVGGHPRLPAPGAGRGGARAAGLDEPRDVRRADPPAGDRAGPGAGRDHRRSRCSRCSSADSGSVAVEVAAKMAVQYWSRRGRPAKHRLITWRGGYHGDTLHPMSVCDPVGGMHALWRPCCPTRCSCPSRRPASTPAGSGLPAALGRRRWPSMPTSWRRSSSSRWSRAPAGCASTTPATCAALRELADRHGVLLIFDEIATGFGRTGTLFAADHAGVVAGHLLPGQGDDRRLPVDGGHPVHRRGGRADLAGPGSGAGARADLHGQPAGGGGVAGLDRAAARPATGPARWPGSSAACGAAWRRCPALAGVRDVRVLGGDRGGAAGPSGGRARPPPPPRSSTGCGCGRSAT